MQTLTNGHNLYVHIPSTLKNKVDSFFNKQTPKTREKIYFLLHQINNEGKKTINQREYNKLLGIGNGLTIASILRTLLYNDVLTLTSDYVEKVKSKEFKLTTPYSKEYDKQTDYQLYYNDPNTNPVWVNKFLRQFKAKEPTSDAAIIAGQAKEIADLKALVANLRTQLAGDNGTAQHVELQMIESTSTSFPSITLPNESFLCDEDYLSGDSAGDGFFANPDNIIDKTKDVFQVEPAGHIIVQQASKNYISTGTIKTTNTYDKSTDTYTISNGETGKKYRIIDAAELKEYFANSSIKSKEFIKRRLSEIQFENLPSVQIGDYLSGRKLVFAIAEIAKDKEYVMKLVKVK